jgi:hypothetical protein
MWVNSAGRPDDVNEQVEERRAVCPRPTMLVITPMAWSDTRTGEAGQLAVMLARAEEPVHRGALS